MQGFEYFTKKVNVETTDLGDLKLAWLEARDYAIKQSTWLNKVGVTKQLCNRLLEPFMWTTMLITGSKEGWDNFFNLRCPSYKLIGLDKENVKSRKEWLEKMQFSSALHPSMYPKTDVEWLQINKGQAEIHMMALAESIYDAMNESIPKKLQAGEWHVPFAIEITDLYIKNKGYVPDTEIPINEFVKISTAMAAHTSYTVVGGEAVKSYEKWIELHDKLIAYDPPHSSPMEHCARAMSDEEYECFLKGKREINKNANHWSDVEYFYDYDKIFGWCNNLKGFIPYRYFIDNNLTF